MKNRYSPYTNNPKIRHFYPVSNLLRKIINGIRCRKLKVEYKQELPKEPLLVCANHACDFGPLAMDKAHKRPHRIWSVDTIIRVKSIPRHLLDNVLRIQNKVLRGIMWPFMCLVAVPMSCYIRSQEPIPVYYDNRLRKTIDKSIETLNDGYDIVLYPEWRDKAEGYKYVNEVKNGVAFTAKSFIEKYHKPANIVPVYVCESLKKVIYGRPLIIEHIANFKEDALKIKKYIMDEIESMASALPPHDITPYDISNGGATLCNPRAKERV